MKYSVSLYSFMGAIRQGELTPIECVAKAKELGFDAIEVVDFLYLNGTKEEMLKQAAELKAEADKHGLEISCLSVGADFVTGSDGDLNAEIQKVKDYVDVAKALGAPRMRHDITHSPLVKDGKSTDYKSMIPTFAAAAREITEYAAAQGIVTMTENHGHVSQDSERVEALYAAVNHENFGLLCDIGNFACADEDSSLAVARVAPHARYVHAKDFIIKDFYSEDPGEGAFRTRAGNYLRGTIIGHGNVPVKKCLRTLKAAGYDDTIAIEFEGVEPSVTGIRIGLANLKRYWDEV